MSIIQLNAENCKNCYKCIRECEIKSIEFKDGRAKIINDECILCGKCVLNCPQNAKFVRNDVERVKEFLARGKRVYVTVAPSWTAWYANRPFSELSAALKKLGVCGVEETAIGAHETSREYAQLMNAGKMKNIIATACPSVCLLVEKKYPELISQLAPVSSPMMAHARLMRQAYGDDIAVVFVGPCFAKKEESTDPLAGGLVSCALTFSNLDEWFRKEKIELGEKDSAATGVTDKASRLYPKPTGILATIKNKDFGKYRALAVDGLENCIEALEAVKSGKVENVFLEMNVCAGGCLGGPTFRLAEKNVLSGQLLLSEDAQTQDKNPAKTAGMEYLHPRVFADKRVKHKKPSEAEIREILLKTGKVTKKDELNCGSCGYPTCRDKAIAVYYGKADINMCLPFFRDRAESLSNTVIEHSPNGIIAFDDNFNVLDMNPKAEELYGVVKAGIAGQPIPQFYGDEGFDACRTGEPYNRTVELTDPARTVEMTMTYIAEHKMYLVFAKDITDTEKQKKDVENIRINTIEVAQKVIDKQMRVAQEIASLLGETTAETKVALTNLKKSVQE